MAVRVQWSKRAEANLLAIYAHVANDAPLAAARLLQRLVDAGDALADNPRRGRRMSAGFHELTIVRPYIIRYRISPDAVTILRVRHGARRPLR